MPTVKRVKKRNTKSISTHVCRAIFQSDTAEGIVQLAKTVQVPYNSIWRILAKQRDPRSTTLKKIARGLGMTMDELFEIIHSKDKTSTR